MGVKTSSRGAAWARNDLMAGVGIKTYITKRFFFRLEYKNPIVQENCRSLKKTGTYFVEPKKGKLACGLIGEGHIAEVEDIIKAVEDLVRLK